MKDFVHRYVLHNIGLKLLSLTLAVGLWLAVTRDPVAEVAVEVAIEFHHLPENLEVSSESIPQAQIRVRGPERLVRRLGPSDIPAGIALNGAREGERACGLGDHQVRTPHGTALGQVVPGHLV